MSGQDDTSRTPAEIAARVHRQVLARHIAQSGWTPEQILAETGWRESRLLHLLDRIGPMKYEDLFTVLEVTGGSREVFFEEVCQVLATLEGGRA
jgi:hypothetical protein